MSYFFNEAARVEHLEHVESNSRLLFESTAYQVFLTTSYIGLLIQTLKFWSLPRIVGGQATGWVDFNWSPKADACGSA